MKTDGLRGISAVSRQSISVFSAFLILIFIVFMAASCAEDTARPQPIISPIPEKNPVQPAKRITAEPEIAKAVAAPDIAGRWIGSWKNEWAESSDFMFTIDKKQNDKYSLTVYESCDQNAEVIVQMNASLQQNKLIFAGSSSMWDGTGTAMLENNTFKGTFKGNESGTFTLHKTVKATPATLVGKWKGNRSDQWGWNQPVFIKITADTDNYVSIDIFESADMLYSTSAITGTVDSQGKLTFNEPDIYGNAYQSKNILMGAFQGDESGTFKLTKI